MEYPTASKGGAITMKISGYAVRIKHLCDCFCFSAQNNLICKLLTLQEVLFIQEKKWIFFTEYFAEFCSASVRPFKISPSLKKGCKSGHPCFFIPSLTPCCEEYPLLGRRSFAQCCQHSFQRKVQQEGQNAMIHNAKFSINQSSPWCWRTCTGHVSPTHLGTSGP